MLVKPCQEFHNNTVVKVKSERMQAVEVWTFCYAKQKNVSQKRPAGSGDVWTWTALDADSKLIVSWFVGDREAGSAYEFMNDVAARLENRVQLTTDCHKAYFRAVENALGSDIDYAMLIKCTVALKAQTSKIKIQPGCAIYAAEFNLV